MKLRKINNQLPLTIQNANISDFKDSTPEEDDNFIAISNLSTNFAFAENFYKPISKMITVNEIK